MSRISQKATLIVFLLFLIGALFRFYDLNWGAPYYFHPDERNIANSIAQLAPTQLNPKFFAYGSLPIYAVYFVGIYSHFFQPTFTNTISFSEAIFISRIYSSIFSVLLIPLLYLLGKSLRGAFTGIFAAFLATFSVGFIQFAHFGTFEMWLTFWSTVLLYACLRYYQSASKRWLATIGVTFGILCAVKVSSIALLPLLFVTILLKPKSPHVTTQLKRVGRLLAVGMIACGVYLLTNPFVLLDFHSFTASMRYESSVATGSLPVFYTGEFANVIPILYPFISVFPFLLNPLMTLLFIPAFSYLAFNTYKTKNAAYVLLIITFLLLFLSQAFLYVQWTRYYVPTIPLIILIIAISSDMLLHSTYKKIAVIGIVILCIYAPIQASAFIITTYVEEDTRLQASSFANTHIQPNQKIVSEVYDLGILPFNEKFGTITLYDFYALDMPMSNTDAPPLTNTPYIILPSQRLLKVRIQNPNDYPRGNAFYKDLTSGKLGYKKIYQTPCSIWCRIVYLNNPIDAFEGTASVFDRPVVTIFQRQ